MVGNGVLEKVYAGNCFVTKFTTILALLLVKMEKVILSKSCIMFSPTFGIEGSERHERSISQQRWRK